MWQVLVQGGTDTLNSNQQVSGKTSCTKCHPCWNLKAEKQHIQICGSEFFFFFKKGQYVQGAKEIMLLIFYFMGNHEMIWSREAVCMEVTESQTGVRPSWVCVLPLTITVSPK